jgi:hypothetical protein
MSDASVGALTITLGTVGSCAVKFFDSKYESWNEEPISASIGCALVVRAPNEQRVKNAEGVRSGASRPFDCWDAPKSILPPKV